MTKRIVILGDYEQMFPSSPYVDLLESNGYTFAFYHDDVTEEETIVKRLKDAEIVVLIRERVPLTARILYQLPTLSIISQTGGGAAHIDVEQAKRQGIKILFTGNTSHPSVVELTFGLMFACARQFSMHQRNLQNDQWLQPPGMELQGKRLGLLGFGQIAKRVSLAAQVFGMEVVAWRPTGKGVDEDFPFVEVLTLDEVLETSDVVSVHLKLVPELEGILSRERLLQMKRGSILINTARGALVDEQALVELLEDGHLFGAGIDTFTEEPLKENPFKHCPNVVLTPHIGYVTKEVLRRFADQALRNILVELG